MAFIRGFPQNNLDMTALQILSNTTPPLGFMASSSDFILAGNREIPTAPWMRQKRYEQSLAGLHSEIVDMSDWLLPTLEEHLMRNIALSRTRGLLQRIYSNSSVDLYGSCATGLYLPGADMDICINGNEPSNLQETAKVLSASGHYTNIEVRDRVTVPLIKLLDTYSDIPIDISFNVNPVMSVEWIKRMLNIYPDMFRIVLVLKKMLAVYKLHEPYNGGLSSYALVILVAHFFSCHNLNRNQPASADLGRVLLDFLKFYAVDFDYMKYAIAFSGDSAVFLPKSELRSQSESYVFSSILTIVDPVNLNNDAGQGCHRLHAVQNLFKMLKNMLEMSLTNVCSTVSILNTIVPINAFELEERKIIVRNLRLAKTFATARAMYNYPMTTVQENNVVPIFYGFFNASLPVAFTTFLPLSSYNNTDAVYTTANSIPINNTRGQNTLTDPLVSTTLASDFGAMNMNGAFSMRMGIPITLQSRLPQSTYVYSDLPCQVVEGFSSSQSSPDVEPRVEMVDSSEDSAVELDFQRESEVVAQVIRTPNQQPRTFAPKHSKKTHC